jgi:hypothetical protein
MESLSNWLLAQQTFPSMTTLFIKRLTAWRNHKENNFPEPSVTFLASAYQEQSDIGWFNFLQGRISNQWVEIQSAYYERLESRCTGKTWDGLLIKHLLQVSWEMWNNRNHILRNVHTNADTRISTKLDNRICKEFDIDIDGLAPIHHYMLRHTRLKRLLLWDSPDKTAWLATIKTARMAWHRRIRSARCQRRILRAAIQPQILKDSTPPP